MRERSYKQRVRSVSKPSHYCLQRVACMLLVINQFASNGKLHTTFALRKKWLVTLMRKALPWFVASMAQTFDQAQFDLDRGVLWRYTRVGGRQCARACLIGNAGRNGLSSSVAGAVWQQHTASYCRTPNPPCVCKIRLNQELLLVSRSYSHMRHLCRSAQGAAYDSLVSGTKYMLNHHQHQHTLKHVYKLP